MNRIFADFLEREVPKFNRPVVEGLATLYLDKSVEYIDRVIKVALVHDNLEYLGYHRCSPQEEYVETTKLRSNKRMVDISKSSLYLVKFNFRYTDYTGTSLEFSKYIFLPYVEDGGIMHLKGAKIHITPILNDKVISPSFNSLFVRLLRYKIMFKRTYHTTIVNGNKEMGNVIYAAMYRNSNTDKLPATTKAESCIMHYLLGKMGFDETFNKFLGFVPIVVEGKIDPLLYPSDLWTICKSSKVKPKGFIEPLYEPTDISLIIPNDKYDQACKTMVTQFFYIADHFPKRVNVAMLNNTNVWMILLGHILFSGSYGENKLLTDIKEHYDSLDKYVDIIVIEKLVDSGFDIKDFYELMGLVNNQFNEFVINNSNSSLSVFGKSLEVLYYVLYEITSDIFKVSFKLSKPNIKGQLTAKNVHTLFSKSIKTRGISNLTSNKVCAEGVSYPGDCKYPKLTSKISEQETAPNGKRGRKKRVSLGPDKHLDVSMLEAGSVLFLAKSNPSPMGKVNPYISLDLKTGLIVPNSDFDELRKRTEAKLKGVNYTPT